MAGMEPMVRTGGVSVSVTLSGDPAALGKSVVVKKPGR